MLNIPLKELFAKMPLAELERSMHDFLAPLMAILPEKRLRRVALKAIRGILAQGTPVIAAMAQSTLRQVSTCWAGAKQIYRFMWNKRFNHHHLFKAMYQIARRSVAAEAPPYLVVAIDPVNFEKPYTKKLEGVSTVRKSTPPDLNGRARLTHGYPAITATVVNTTVPAVSYANWFSYKTADFVSENREIQRAVRTTRWVFAGQRLRFVMDSGGDDQKNFAFLTLLQKGCDSPVKTGCLPQNLKDTKKTEKHFCKITKIYVAILKFSFVASCLRGFCSGVLFRTE